MPAFEEAAKRRKFRLENPELEPKIPKRSIGVGAYVAFMMGLMNVDLALAMAILDGEEPWYWGA